MYGDLLELISKAGLALHAIEIRRGGETELKLCFDGDIQYPIYSGTKSVTATAVLIAQSEGKLDLSDKLCQYLCRKNTVNIPEAFKQLDFRDFMTMTAGPYPFRPQEAEALVKEPVKDDWLANVLALDIDHSDRRFHYSNIPAFLVAAACENAVGKHLAKYLTPRLFVPLGFEDVIYQNAPGGGFYGATGMKMKISEFAALGQLYLDPGKYNGARLIPEELARQAVTEQVKTPEGGYGYFFRTYEDGWYISGKWGQASIICPKKQTVITYLSEQPERSVELLELVKAYIKML